MIREIERNKSVNSAYNNFLEARFMTRTILEIELRIDILSHQEERLYLGRICNVIGEDIEEIMDYLKCEIVKQQGLERAIVDYVTPYQLTKDLKLEDKTAILFKIEDKYPALFEQISVRVEQIVDDLLGVSKINEYSENQGQ